MKRKLSKLLGVVLIATLTGCGIVTSDAFRNMSGEEVYALVENSDQNWLLTSYDLITPENAKEAIVISDENGKTHFNLAWPRYGGFVPESIASIKELSGKLDVSRIGGDGGHSMSYGRNGDGYKDSYPRASAYTLPARQAG